MQFFKNMLIVVVRFLVRVTVARIVLAAIISRVVIDNKLIYINLVNPLTFLLIFILLAVMLFNPEGIKNLYFINPSKQIENEIKRGNDLKELELKIQQDNFDFFTKIKLEEKIKSEAGE